MFQSAASPPLRESDLPVAELSAARAFANRKTTNASWAASPPDQNGEVWPDFKPSFRFPPNAKVFTIGSCFARNIETALGEIGCRVPMLDFRSRPEEWEGRPASMLNKFTPPNFRDSLGWAASIYDRDGIVTEADCASYALEVGPDAFVDIDTASYVDVSMRRFIERRQQIYDVFSQAFRADVAVMTPGYIEAWLDKETGRYMAGALKVRRAVRDTERFVWQLRSYEDSLADMLEAIDIVRARNPVCRFLVTASPVPLGTTFSGRDIRTANAYSKAIVRAVVGTLPFLREGVDYFPSYESATLSDPRAVWKEDRIHVKQSFIDAIVARLQAAYIV